MNDNMTVVPINKTKYQIMRNSEIMNDDMTVVPVLPSETTSTTGSSTNPE